MSDIVETHAAAARDLPQGKLIIDGRDLPHGAGEALHVNPSTGKPQASVALAGPREINAAVAAARKALPVWSAMPPTRRRDLLQAMAEGLRSEGERLATIAALE